MRLGNFVILNLTPAADEVDDFQTVAVFEDDLRPVIAGGDFAVKFDRYSIGFHPQGFEQGCERKEVGGLGIEDGTRFAVDVKDHDVACNCSLV